MWQVATLLVALGVAAFWFVVLRPQAIGGPASYVLVSGHSMLPTLRDGDVLLACLAGALVFAFVLGSGRRAD